MTYSRLLELFPDNDACLDYLKAKFFGDGTPCPKCERPSKFHRISGRSAYSCQFCGHHVYPTAGTIFHKSTVSLQLWFHAIFLMSSTRCGISAKQLEREIGVTYKTAHRMFKQIRTLLADDDAAPLSGEVEMDETAYGGKPRAADIRRHQSQHGITAKRQAAQKWAAENKTTVFGMVERGGRVRAYVVPNRSRRTLFGAAKAYVLPETMIFTDEWSLYKGIGAHFAGHRRVKHKDHVYVDGNVHTNAIEGFFGLFKNGIRGVYHSVSRTYLQNYLDEYAFRYNRRNSSKPMFWAMLDRVENARA